MTTNLVISHPDIPRRAVSIRHTHTWGDENGFNRFDNSRHGRRYTMAKLREATSEPVRVDYNLGADNDSAADHLIVARADVLRDDGCSRVVLRGSSQSAHTPSSISGMALWLDSWVGLTRDSQMRVSSWTDQSGNGATPAQSTDNNKAVLTRGDNRENIIIQSQNPGSVSWTKTNVAATSNYSTNHDGASTAGRVLASAGAAQHRLSQALSALPTSYGKAGQTFVYDFYLKYVNYQYVWVGDAGDTVWHGVNVDIQNGTLDTQTNVTNASISSLGSGWYRVRFSVTKSVSSQFDSYVAFSQSARTTGSTSFTAAGTEEFLIGGACLRISSADSDEVISTTAPEIAGLNANRALRFDGVNDSMLFTSTPASLDLTGDFTLFSVVRLNSLTTGGILDNETRDVKGWMYRVNSSGIFQVNTNQAGAHTSLDSTTPLAIGATYVHSFVKETSTGTHYLNGAADGTGTVSDAVSGAGNQLYLGYTPTGAYLSGFVGEVLVYDRALTTDERQAVEAYLTTKWQTAPVVNIDDLGDETLIGDTDLLVEFNETAEFKHWWLEFDGVSTQLPLSKVYFGRLLDLDDPDTLSAKWSGVQRDQFVSGSGARHLGIAGRSLFRVNLEFTACSDDDVIHVVENVLQPAGLNEGCFLIARNNLEVLDGVGLRHMRLLDGGSPKHEKQDYNRVAMSFEELPD